MTLSKEGLDEKALNFAAIEMAKIRGVSCDDEVDQRMFGAAAARIITAYLAALPEPDGLVERLEKEASLGNSIYSPWPQNLLREAATVIQNLQRERDELREALRPVAERAVGYEHLPGFETDTRFQHLRRARLLLKEGGE